MLPLTRSSHASPGAQCFKNPLPESHTTRICGVETPALVILYWQLALMMKLLKIKAWQLLQMLQRPAACTPGELTHPAGNVQQDSPGHRLDGLEDAHHDAALERHADAKCCGRGDQQLVGWTQRHQPGKAGCFGQQVLQGLGHCLLHEHDVVSSVSQPAIQQRCSSACMSHADAKTDPRSRPWSRPVPGVGCDDHTRDNRGTTRSLFPAIWQSSCNTSLRLLDEIVCQLMPKHDIDQNCMICACQETRHLLKALPSRPDKPGRTLLDHI